MAGVWSPPNGGRICPLPGARSSAATGAGDPRRGLRVLVVDGYADAADSLALLVRLWAHDARVAYTGPAALEAAQA